jgi:hypothetical protein
MVPRASSTIFMFSMPDTFSAVRRASGPVFMFCTPGLIFGGSEGFVSRYAYFASLNSFSAVSRVSGPVFMFCAPRLMFSRIEVVGSHFHFLSSRTHFRWYRGCRSPFSYCARPNSFSTDPRASGPVFMFCVPDSFSAVPRALGPIFMFCVSALIFCGTEGVGSRFHVLRSMTHFRRYRGRRVPFERFACLNSFSAAPRSSGPVFMFCAPGFIFGGSKRVGSRFHVLRRRTRF